MKQQNLLNRHPIWEQLSHLYLDTELSEEDIRDICQTFRSSPFDLASLKEIDLYEVFPVLQAYLHSVAGNWSGFDREWLISNCTKSYHKKSSNLYRLRCKLNNYLWYWMRKDYWKKIEHYLQSGNNQGAGNFN